MEIRGKVALITGGASGIGLATAKRLAAAGASVMLVDVQEKLGAAAAAEIEKAGGRAAYISADVTDSQQLRQAFEQTVARFAGLNIVFNNAGIATGQPAFPEPAARWRKVLDIDLYSVVLGCQLAYEIMAPRGGGAIVNTASMAGLAAYPGDPVYAAAKAGVVNLTASLAPWIRQNIRVNCVCPGVVDTPLVAQLEREAGEAGRRSGLPANLLKPDQIAEVVELFVRDEEQIGQAIEVRPSGRRKVELRRPPGRPAA